MDAMILLSSTAETTARIVCGKHPSFGAHLEESIAHANKAMLDAITRFDPTEPDFWPRAKQHVTASVLKFLESVA